MIKLVNGNYNKLLEQNKKLQEELNFKNKMIEVALPYLNIGMPMLEKITIYEINKETVS